MTVRSNCDILNHEVTVDQSPTMLRNFNHSKTFFLGGVQKCKIFKYVEFFFFYTPGLSQFRGVDYEFRSFRALSSAFISFFFRNKSKKPMIFSNFKNLSPPREGCWSSFNV